MAMFENPFDSMRRLTQGCSCDQHASQAEHDRATALQCQLVESEDKRFEGVVASAVMRAMFPKDVARRAFLQSVGASTALAAISQFFPLATATEVFAQGGPIEKKKLAVGFGERAGLRLQGRVKGGAEPVLIAGCTGGNRRPIAWCPPADA